jgi:hypothetical protein
VHSGGKHEAATSKQAGVIAHSFLPVWRWSTRYIVYILYSGLRLDRARRGRGYRMYIQYAYTECSMRMYGVRLIGSVAGWDSDMSEEITS